MDCPSCRFHPTYKPGDRIWALCLHPLGELYRDNFDNLHLIAPCHGWAQNKENGPCTT